MIRGIVLAAGASRRMGCDKLHLPWRGTTVLEATLARWLAVPALGEILLVRRRRDPAECWPRVRVVVNPAPDEGMGSSLRLAVRALPADTVAVVVGLADMPEVASDTITRLVDAFRAHGPRAIVAPVFGGRRGHPVVFGAAHLPALATLAGDAGARAVLHDAAADVVRIPVADRSVVYDLDIPEDCGACG